ncbi:MAG: hypothetical protein II695_06460 [Oscillospiraceae bacterium]|nr:hypothetical protein [Oscillospiraceae bacterium]
MDYSEEITRDVKDFLDNDDWHYSYDEEDKTFKFNLSLRSKLSNASFFISINPNCAAVYAVLPVSVPDDDAEAKKRMAEFICRASCGLRIGSFEFDYDTGTIRYHVGVPAMNRSCGPFPVKEAVNIAAGTIDRYAPGLTAVLFTDKSPKEAVEMCDQ